MFDVLYSGNPYRLPNRSEENYKINQNTKELRNNLSLKYQRFTISGCKKIVIRKFEIVAKTQFLCKNLQKIDKNLYLKKLITRLNVVFIILTSLQPVFKLLNLLGLNKILHNVFHLF